MLPPLWLIRSAVATVWFYEGVWCKLLCRDPRQLEVVGAVPFIRPRIGKLFLWTLGAVETALAVWVLIGAAPLLCATVQTVLLVTLNANGLLFARHVIHDPGEMVVKNVAFLVLAWVAAGLSSPT